MRHAKTENWYQGTDDEGRALTARGWEDAQLMRDALIARGWLPERVLLSTARRTRETWKAMSEGMETARHEVREDLYLATQETLLDLTLEALDETDCLLVIGHNPSMRDVAVQLAEAHTKSDYEGLRSLEAKMPTCAVALFEQDTSGAPPEQSLQLIDVLTAKSLRPA